MARPDMVLVAFEFARQDVDQVEDAQRVQHPEDHGDGHGRADQRQGHLEEDLHRVDAVELGCS